MSQVTVRCVWLAALLAGCTGLSLHVGCARNPVTGRPEAVVMTEAAEIEQGKEAATLVEENIGLVTDPALQAYVDGIGQRLAAHSPRDNLSHSFHVVDMVEPNAFALPGGHIYVSRGLLALVNDESELATVIGHEIGHVAARHSVTRQTVNAPLIPVRIASALGGWAVGIVSPNLGRIVEGAGTLPGSIALAKYGRDQELEADRLGQIYAAAAGWDPESLAGLMHSLARESELHGEDPDRFSFFQSHPTSPERSAQALEFATTLSVAPDMPAPLPRAALFDRLSGIVVGLPAAEGVFVGERFLHPDLRIGLSLPEGWTYHNLPAAVLAQHDSEKANILLELAGEGSDPVEIGQAVLAQQRIRAPVRETTVGSLLAAETDFETGSWRKKTRAHITWIASDGFVYQVLGVTSKDVYAEVRPQIESTVASFHELSASELAEIQDTRLRAEQIAAGEDLDALIERTGSQWSKPQTEVANGLEGDYVLDPGALIKLALPEPYVARPRATP